MVLLLNVRKCTATNNIPVITFAASTASDAKFTTFSSFLTTSGGTALVSNVISCFNPFNVNNLYTALTLTV